MSAELHVRKASVCKCLELVEQFGPDELPKVLVTLAAQSVCGRGLVPLLWAISYHLVQKPFPLTQKELQETLKALLGSTDQGSLEVVTQYGWVLDAEVLLDADGHFLPLRDFVAPHLAQPVGNQPLSPGVKRIAFLSWEFPNFNCRSKDLLGRFVPAAAGFLVVDVPSYEGLDLKSGWQKGACLKDKMREAVAEELAK
ncbi:Protein TBRG4 [Cricetulus griseus]|uniref:Protein TBRG4 n=1 Tax=Cricetulus griseus TaxID=10029 RepID=G3I8W6_CRIGR|nr:Protein TBRG4 [Cricetulus griseus]